MTTQTMTERIPSSAQSGLAGLGAAGVPLAVAAWSPLLGGRLGAGLGLGGAWWLRRREGAAVVVEPVAAPRTCPPRTCPAPHRRAGRALELLRRQVRAEIETLEEVLG